MCPDYKKQQTKIKTKTKLMCLDNKGIKFNLQE